ncbi:MAG TPA: AI-2E family transporter, partial [Cellulomonas sp.]|nr:AI-2E family transporter [Cellulomonas sp.]
MSPPARKVAGARRSPEPPSANQTAPHWLRSLAGVSWRLIVVVVAIGIVFYAVWHVLLLFVALFLALVFTAVLRPLVDWLSRGIPRGAATGLGLLTGIVFFLGLLFYVGYSIVD